jgi:hypothetical protein
MTPAEPIPENRAAPAEGKLEPKAISLKTFFEDVPPGSGSVVENALEIKAGFSPLCYQIRKVDLDLYCDTPEKCGGIRSFAKSADNEQIYRTSSRYQYSVHVRFTCRNCQTTVKLYSLLVNYKDGVCGMIKLAEVPDFGPPTPAKVIKIVGPEKDYYLKGRRCENQGLGIAAFVYYRRVVENQKNRIIDEVIRVAKKINGPKEMLDSLEASKMETQFLSRWQSRNPPRRMPAQPLCQRRMPTAGFWRGARRRCGMTGRSTPAPCHHRENHLLVLSANPADVPAIDVVRIRDSSPERPSNASRRRPRRLIRPHGWPPVAREERPSSAPANGSVPSERKLSPGEVSK